MYSTTFVAGIINILVIVLPLFGINVGSAELTTTIQTIIAIGSAVWVMYQRTKLEKAPMGQGDVSVLGLRK